jgi:stringent starvation protein B
MEAVLGIFARENGQGLFFPASDAAAATPVEADSSGDTPPAPTTGGRPKLQVVK